MAEPTAADRLDALEMRLTHQEAATDDLNAVLTAQGDRIDRLLREIGRLHERLRDAEARAAPGAAAEPPPPHY